MQKILRHMTWSLVWFIIYFIFNFSPISYPLVWFIIYTHNEYTVLEKVFKIFDKIPEPLNSYIVLFHAFYDLMANILFRHYWIKCLVWVQINMESWFRSRHVVEEHNIYLSWVIRISSDIQWSNFICCQH